MRSGKEHNGILLRALMLAIFCLMIMLAAPARDIVSAASDVSFIEMTLNNRLMKQKAVARDGAVYVPLEAVAQALKMPFEWKPDQKRATLNGKPLRGKAYKINGVLYVPAIAMAENSNARIKFDVKKSVLAIFTGAVAVKPLTPTTSIPVMATPTSVPTQTAPEPFNPKNASNDVFKITLTNIETVNTMKGHYTPRSGCKFVIIYVSQQNISDEVQIYTGKLALMDSNGQAHEYMDALSNFWLLVLKPGGINFGYLVFEIPTNAVPMQVVLATTTRPPLTLNIK
jgi:hypothetical protein